MKINSTISTQSSSPAYEDADKLGSSILLLTKTVSRDPNTLPWCALPSQVTVTNTGAVPGGIAVLCFVSANQTVVSDPPHRWVFDFARAPVLKPGESQRQTHGATHW